MKIIFTLILSVLLGFVDAQSSSQEIMKSWEFENTGIKTVVKELGKPDCEQDSYTSMNLGFRLRFFFTFMKYEKEGLLLKFECPVKDKRKNKKLIGVQLDSNYIFPEIGKSMVDTIYMEDIINNFGLPIDSLKSLPSSISFDPDSIDTLTLNETNSFEINVIVNSAGTLKNYRLPNSIYGNSINYEFNDTAKLTFLFINNQLIAAFILVKDETEQIFEGWGNYDCHNKRNGG